MPAKATVKPSKKHKVLVYSKPSVCRHGSIPIGIKALRVMAENLKLRYPKNLKLIGVSSYYCLVVVVVVPLADAPKKLQVSSYILTM